MIKFNHELIYNRGDRYKKITPDEEYNYILKAQGGCQKSKEILIHSQLYNIYDMAVKYKFMHIPMADIFMDACYGLLKAIEKYKIVKGKRHRLSTIAFFYMKRHIYWGFQHAAKTISYGPKVMTDVICGVENKNTEMYKSCNYSFDFQHPDDEDEKKVRIDFDSEEDEGYTNLEIREMMELFKDRISERDYRAVQLHIEGLSNQEIGDIIGTSTQNVSNIIRASAKKLEQDHANV